MGKPTGFLDYEREDAKASSPKERIKNFNEFHEHLSEEKQKCHIVRLVADLAANKTVTGSVTVLLYGGKSRSELAEPYKQITNKY